MNLPQHPDRPQTVAALGHALHYLATRINEVQDDIPAPDLSVRLTIQPSAGMTESQRVDLVDLLGRALGDWPGEPNQGIRLHVAQFTTAGVTIHIHTPLIEGKAPNEPAHDPTAD